MTKISPGDRFGHWTVLAPSKERPYYFTCRCDCGTVKDVYRSSLLQGTSTQCPACAFSAISDGLHRSVVLFPPVFSAAVFPWRCGAAAVR